MKPSTKKHSRKGGRSNPLREHTTGRQPSGDANDPNNRTDFARRGFGRGALSMIAPIKSLNR